MQKDKRGNLGIELLRIVAMMIVISWHYGIYSDISFEAYHPNVLVLNAICGGATGNAIFMMIAGFFLGTKKEGDKGSALYVVKREKIAKLLGLATFYSVLFYLILPGRDEVSGVTDLIRTTRSVVLPYLYGDYWFIAIYILMYYFHPYINIMIDNISKEMFEGLLAVFSIVCIVLPSLFETTESFSNILEMFVFYYLVGAYISRYKIYEKIKMWQALIVFAASVMIRVLLMYSYYHYAESMGFISWNDLIRRMKNAYFVFNIIIAVSLLLFFVKVQITNKVVSIIIRFISSFTLGVYLIHESAYFRPFWWTIIGGNKYASSNYLFVHLLCSVIITFATCMLIEGIRRIICGSVIKLFRLVTIKK